jgi:Flp pilus assembly protein protease CpaA
VCAALADAALRTSLVRIILSAYLALAAVWDLRTRRVPNWLTLPLLVAVLAWRVARWDWAFVPYWCGCLAAWLLNSLGGGDVKLLMGLFGLFPRVEMFYLLLVFAGIGIGVVLVARHLRARSLRAWLISLAGRVVRLELFPSRSEMEAGAEPFTLLISLAGVAYVWVFT